MRAATRLRLVLLLSLFVVALQLSASDKPADLRLGKLRVNKVAILGNSITLHGPLEKIGWLHNWGMAASAEEKDFAHLLLKKIETACGGKPKAYIRNIADFEREYATFEIATKLKEAIDFQPDLVIIAIGENVPAPETDAAKEAYRAACEKLLRAFDHPGHPAIIVRSSFWAHQTKDDLIHAACEAVGGEYVDLKGLDADEKNYARSEQKFDHAGVAAHPGDRGMAAIAAAIWRGIERKAGMTPKN